MGVDLAAWRACARAVAAGEALCAPEAVLRREVLLDEAEAAARDLEARSAAVAAWPARGGDLPPGRVALQVCAVLRAARASAALDLSFRRLLQHVCAALAETMPQAWEISLARGPLRRLVRRCADLWRRRAPSPRRAGAPGAAWVALARGA